MARETVNGRIHFIIPGRPVPAVRMTQRSKFADPNAQRYLAYKQAVAVVAGHLINPRPLPWNYFGIAVRVYLKRIKPKRGDAPRLPRNAGDWDNVGKSLCDALQQARVFDNDALVIEALVRIYPCESADDERVSVELWETTEEG